MFEIRREWARCLNLVAVLIGLAAGIGGTIAGVAGEATPVAGEYQLPDGDDVVIHAVSNNGSLPPQYQSGYEVTIDATGLAHVVVTPQGASRYLATPTARQETFEVKLGDDGLQHLLNELDRLGFFALAAHDDATPVPLRVGGPVSQVTVTLADGEWDAFNGYLLEEDWARLEEIQAAIATAVGLEEGVKASAARLAP